MHLEINLTPQAFSYATLGSNGMIYIPPFGLNESIDYMLKMDPTTYAITKIKLDVDESTEKWQNGIVYRNLIYFLPYNESKILVVDTETDAWGIRVENVELKDFFLPQDMERTIAKQAEAERERRAVIIKAEGEVAAAENMAKAANMLAEAPGALHLRTLQSLNDLSSDQSNTVVFATPIEVLKAFEGFNK